jgi:hypothetical protein
MSSSNDNVVKPLPRDLLAAVSEVYIVAGGPSLRGFDFSRLDRKFCIAINKSIFELPYASMLWWSDMRFYSMHKERIDGHRAPYKVTGITNLQTLKYPEKVYIYTFSGHGGYDERREHLKDGNNSGFASLSLAIKLGAKRIRLLGYDFKFDDSAHSHWHDGHYDERGQKIRHTPDTFSKRMLPYFATLKEKTDELGIDIINANPDSLLDVWPKRRIDDVVQEKAKTIPADRAH